MNEGIEILKPGDKRGKPKRQTHTEWPKRIFNHKSGASMVVNSAAEMAALPANWHERKEKAPGAPKEPDMLPKVDETAKAAEAPQPTAEVSAPKLTPPKPAKTGGKKKAAKKKTAPAAAPK